MPERIESEVLQRPEEMIDDEFAELCFASLKKVLDDSHSASAARFFNAFTDRAARPWFRESGRLPLVPNRKPLTYALGAALEAYVVPSAGSAKPAAEAETALSDGARQDLVAAAEELESFPDVAKSFGYNLLHGRRELHKIDSISMEILVECALDAYSAAASANETSDPW
jgi:hypothetical protein